MAEFPAGQADFTGEVAAQLRSLVDRKLVRVLDLLILHKDEQGEVEVMERHEVDEGLAGEQSGIPIDVEALAVADARSSVGISGSR